MWFKALRVYTLENKMAYEPDALAEQLATFAFRACPPSFSYSYGFVPPVGQGDEAPLVHAANGYMMFCLQGEEKILPASVVREALAEKILTIEAEEHRRVSRAEKQALKEELTLTLMPKAFSRKTKFYAYIDTHKQCLVLNTTSKRQIEKFMSLFQKACPSTPLVPAVAQPISALLTDYLKTQAPKGFYLLPRCVLKDPDDTARAIRTKDHDLASPLFGQLLNDNYWVTELRMNWQDRIDFTLNRDFDITSIKFDVALKELSKTQSSETEAERFDTDFYIMTQHLSEFLNDLLECVAKCAPAKAAEVIA